MDEKQSLITVVLAYTPKKHFNSNTYLCKEVNISSSIEELIKKFTSLDYNGATILEGVSECEINSGRPKSKGEILTTGKFNEGSVYLLHLKNNNYRDENRLSPVLKELPDFYDKKTFPERSFEMITNPFYNIELKIEPVTLKLVTDSVIDSAKSVYSSIKENLIKYTHSHK